MPQTSRFRVFALLVLFGMLITQSSRAQTAVDGAVGGTVADGSGAIVGGATVTVLNNATNAEQTATADSSGYFRVIHLQPGTYNVTISASGFEPYKSVDVTVQVGLLTTIDAHMQVGSTSQTVEVTGAAPAGEYHQSGFCRHHRSKGPSRSPGQQLPLVQLCSLDAWRGERLERLRPAQLPRPEHPAE